jgi:hypothetical protein
VVFMGIWVAKYVRTFELEVNISWGCT